METPARTEDFELVVIADVPPSVKWLGVRMRYVPWTPQTEVLGLQQFDVGLMPLQDNPFEGGKCGLKVIQYMGCGVPAVVSPVGVNEQIVVDGQTGFHCRSPRDWVERLRLLIRDQDLRHKMGAAARARVEEHYSLQSLLPQMVRLFERVAGFTPSPNGSPCLNMEASGDLAGRN